MSTVASHNNILENTSHTHGKPPVLLASRNHHIDVDDDEATAKEQSQTPFHAGSSVPPETRALDIIKYLIGTIAGKDKIAKLVKCVLDVVRKFALVFPRFRSLIGNARLLGLIASQLSLFRYIMRFGSSPYIVSPLLRHFASVKQILANPGALFNQSLLSDSINVYSTIFDELSLMDKLGLVKSKQFRQTISKHETWATEVDTLYSLKSACVKYRNQRADTDKKTALLNKIDVARFTLELVSNSTDFLAVRSPAVQNAVSLFASLCSATSGVVNLWRLWILATEHLAKSA